MRTYVRIFTRRLSMIHLHIGSISFEEDLLLPMVYTMMNVGERLTFSCTVSNHHAMQWEKPGKVEVTNSSDGRVTVGGNGALTFTHLTHEDTNKYFCFAYIYSTPSNRETLQAANIFRPLVVKGTYVCTYVCMYVRMYMCV